MTSPVTAQPPTIQFTIVLSGDQVNALLEQMKRPLPPAPEAAKIEETSHEKFGENIKKLAQKTGLARVKDMIVAGAEKVLQVIAFPVFLVGCGLLAFGLGQTLFVLATTLSVAMVLESQALVTLLLGGVLYKLGQDILKGNDLNTILGNILYIPLPFLLRMAK